MARLDRYVTAPDGLAWIVGRRFLFGPPRYIGFRFGRPKRQAEPMRVKRVAQTRHPPQSTTAVVRGGPVRSGSGSGIDPAPLSGTDDSSGNSGSQTGSRPGRSSSRRYRHSGGTIFVPVPTGSWGGGGSSGGFSSSTGTRSISASTSARGLTSSTGSRSSGGSKGSKGGAGGAVAGIGAALVKFLKIALIVIAIAVATWLTIFVLIPALIFGVWALLVGISMAWHALSRRPWIVEATEDRDAPNVRAWAVIGWRQSADVINEIADAIAEGREPRPVGASEVAVE